MSQVPARVVVRVRGWLGLFHALAKATITLRGELPFMPSE
jgi:hypothetical protein